MGTLAQLRTYNTTIWYLVILFVLSYLWQFFIFLTGGVESKFIPLLMFFPAILAIVFRLITKEGLRKIGWGLGKWWYVIPAIFVPLVFTLVIVYILEALNWATLSVFIFNNGMVDSKVTLFLGNHTQSIAFFAVNLAISFIGICLIGSVFAFGEEFGWRGHLQEKLLRKFGLNWGSLFWE